MNERNAVKQKYFAIYAGIDRTYYRPYRRATKTLINVLVTVDLEMI